MTTRILTVARAASAVVAAGVVAALAALIFGALPAAAHASLISSTPEDGATLAEPPSQVVLEFDGEILAEFTQVAVLDEEGVNHAQGDAEVSGSRVTQRVAPLQPGEYRVSYRVGSPDGHPVSGVITFTVTMVPGETDQDAPDSSAPTDTATEPSTEQGASTPTTEPAAAQDDGDAAVDGDTPLWIAGAAAVVVGGAAVAFVVTRRPGDDSGPTQGPGP